MVLTHASYYRGASHIDAGSVVEDRAEIRIIDYGGGRQATALFVSDGHGGEEYYRSHIGAELAIDAAAETLPSILDRLQGLIPLPDTHRGISGCDYQSDDWTPTDTACENIMRGFFGKINAAWAKKVLEHRQREHPVAASIASPAKAYGCTLLCAVRADGFWFAFQLGDGACAAIDSDGASLDPIPDDSRCFMSHTTSMCSCTPADFRYTYGSNIPPVLMLCSDGLADCFMNNHDLASQFLIQIAIDTVEMGFDAVEEDIAHTLPRLSEQYTRDDMAIALWIDDNSIRNIHTHAVEIRSQIYHSELNTAYEELNSCCRAICEMENSIASTDNDGDIERKMSVLSTFRRRQSELLGHIDDLNNELDNENI